MTIRPAAPADAPDWIRMRTALWPDSPADHPPEIERFFDEAGAEMLTLVAENPAGGLCGFLEAGTRPYAEGCLTSPVGYIEGWWVDPGSRRRGVGRLLVAAAEDWARGLGLEEIASDADVANALGRSAHRALGYAETQQIVCYRKSL